ncbi:lipase family protein [Roseisolibacter sp. H3M3-2]|uniref:lipase family protein n=1 Tax=Roseisolibacter sp. H3M3-2 TaxID=3031323 RepID=UPI0023DCA886|nr:lipase family protein [Roseisolibacter sp. H3M3-2]MDF1506090.1 lipase family protein [Roseisolibacter sp. H3M3-2]
MSVLVRRLALAALLAVVACDDGTTDPGEGGGAYVQPPVPSPTLVGRGDLVSATPAAANTRQEVALVLAATGFTSAFTARHDTRAFVVRYRTPGVDGQLTTASGIVWVPVGATGALPVVTYMHGTVTNKQLSPSFLSPLESRIGAAYASDGWVAILPDYLGLGVAGEGTYHPYLHLQTQSSAAIDLLRATRTLLRQQNLTADWRTLTVTGYSQGGGVAMGLFRELERNFASDFPVMAAAPASGPYDLEGTGRALIEQDPAYVNSVVYTLYLAEAMRRVYQLAPTAGAFFLPPSDVAATAVVEGAFTPQLAASLPARPRGVLQPDVLAAMQAQRDHPLWRALRDNTAYDWTPRAPLRMYYGGADRDVFPQNALTAEARMRANGARNVAAVNLGAALDHPGATLPSVLATKLFADSVRRTLAPAVTLARAAGF